MKTGADFIKEERQRQIAIGRFTARDSYGGMRTQKGELATDAAVRILPETLRPANYEYVTYWRPRTGTSVTLDRITELTKAGALIAAEIDRLLQISQKESGDTVPTELWIKDRLSAAGENPENWVMWTPTADEPFEFGKGQAAAIPRDKDMFVLRRDGEIELHRTSLIAVPQWTWTEHPEYPKSPDSDVVAYQMIPPPPG